MILLRGYLFIYLFRDETVPEEVITRMAGSLEPPHPFKNSWEKFSFVIKPSEDISFDFGKFFSFIMFILLLLLYRLKHFLFFFVDC